jgi:hypothetical protein
MTFEQPANLNRYILPPIPVTWGFRWKLFKFFLPITLFCAALIIESLLIKAWGRDNWGDWLFLRILMAICVLPVALDFYVEFGLWARHKREKSIKLEEDHVQTGPDLTRRIPWQQIAAWQFNNLSDEKNYRVATLEYATIKYKWGPQRRKKLQRDSIVLEKSQTDQLISEVKSRRQKDGLDFSISDQESNFVPKSFELKNVDVAINYLFFAGAFLLIEGLPLLLAGMGMKDDSPDPDFNPNPNGSFAKFVRAHFSSVAGFRHFCVITGAILCGSGLLLIIWGGLLNKKRKTQPIDSY